MSQKETKMKNNFDTLNAIHEISKVAEKWQDIALSLQNNLIKLQEELIKAKQELQERDRGWEAHCQEIEDKMRETIDEVRGEMINETNKEDLL